MGAKGDSQVAAPAELRTPNLHRANYRSTKECGWKDGDRGGPAQTEKTPDKKKENRLDTNRPSHGRTCGQSGTRTILTVSNSPSFICFLMRKDSGIID